MSKSLADRMQEAGLPYESDNIAFIASGGQAVVAHYRRGETSRTFVGFHAEESEAAKVAEAARAMHGVFDAYVVKTSRGA